MCELSLIVMIAFIILLGIGFILTYNTEENNENR